MEIIINSLSEIPKVANAIISSLGNEKIIAFYGQMGVGKTTIIKELCKQLNVIDTPTSPTFSLVNEYLTESGDLIYHFDFYRINNIEEIYDFGCEEYFTSGHLCLTEWTEKVESHLPDNKLKVTIEIINNTGRKIKISS